MSVTVTHKVSTYRLVKCGNKMTTAYDGTKNWIKIDLTQSLSSIQCWTTAPCNAQSEVFSTCFSPIT